MRQPSSQNRAACTLAARLRAEIIALTAIGPVSQDVQFCTQIRASAGAMMVRVSECAVRRTMTAAELAESLAHARRSLLDIQRQLRIAHEGAILSREATDRLWGLVSQMGSALTALLRE